MGDRCSMGDRVAISVFFQSFLRSLQIVGTMHGRTVRGGRDFGPEKCLEVFSITCSVCFENSIIWSTLFLSEMDQNCRFEEFESAPKFQFRREDYLYCSLKSTIFDEK